MSWDCNSLSSKSTVVVNTGIIFLTVSTTNDESAWPFKPVKEHINIKGKIKRDWK